MTYPPSVAEFKAYFVRDFPYGSGTDTVTDGDIGRAELEAQSVFNVNLFSKSEVDPAFFNLTAHILVLNIQTAGGLGAVGSGKGVKNAATGTVQSANVGSVSVGYQLPESLTNSRILTDYTRTNYGRNYLRMLVPRLTGVAFIVAGPGCLNEFNPV